jgi:hypothetical protein
MSVARWGPLTGLLVSVAALAASSAALARGTSSAVVVGNLPVARSAGAGGADAFAVASEAPFTAASEPLAVAPQHQMTAFAARRRARPWYERSDSTFLASEGTLGDRLSGIVIDFNSSGQQVERCSGTVVSSPNQSIVWTAGHCVFRPAEYPAPFAAIEFIPAAQPVPGTPYVADPYGVWSAAAYAMPRDWMRHGSVRHWRRDFAALLIARNAQGETIEQALGGAQGISFRGTTSGNVEVLGYPAAGRFTGNLAEFGCGPRPIGRYTRRLAGPGPDPVGIRCGMTSGASGGPWLRHVNSNGIGTVISNTSTATNKPGFLYGPVLNSVAHSVWSSLAKRPAP